MFLRWLGVGLPGAIAVMLAIAANKNNPWLFVPRNTTAIVAAACVASELKRMQQDYEDMERKEDSLRVLKDTQVEEQLDYVQSVGESRRADEEADKSIERQLRLLEQTAPILTEVLQLTGRNGPVMQMALGMIQKGMPIGDVLTAVADAQMQIEQAAFARTIALQQRQVDVVQYQQPQIGQPTQTVQIESLEPKREISNEIQRAAAIAGIETQCIKVDVAPSYKRLIFKVQTKDFANLTKWKAATKLALGEKNDLPLYVHGPELVAVEISLKPEERKFYDFPSREWVKGDRTIVLGESLDGEIVIDLANEDTPQMLVVGTTGSGKSNFLRAAAYCLLMQGNKVDICGGKVSDYEDFPPLFPNITMNDMGKTFKYVGEYFEECDRRNGMSKAELGAQPAWMLLIDEYKGTVPLDEKLKKTYDQQLCEVVRRGRGLKIHVLIGLQHGSKRNKEDPQGLPPDLRACLPLRIAFKCIEAVDGRMVLHRRGELVTTLQGRGDGIVQGGILDTRFQAYRFEIIPA